MPNNNAKVTQNLERRIEALENDAVDDTAVLTQINKFYADIEVVVTLSYVLHQYLICGAQETFFITPGQPSQETIRCGESVII
jgi:hypothetical protein